MRILCAVCQQKKIFTILGVGGASISGAPGFYPLLSAGYDVIDADAVSVSLCV